MLRTIYIFLILYVLNTAAYTQNLYSLTGVITDDKALPLPGAAVYISGYKFATTTNTEGKFELKNLAPGKYDILVQLTGFLPFTKNISITNKPVAMDIKLIEKTVQLDEVVIHADPERLYNINRFLKFFLGTTPNAAKCKVLNTEVLQPEYDKRTNTLKVTANDFLIIENRALGYKIRYLLEYFEHNYNSNQIIYLGHSTYEDMKGSASTRKKWRARREIAYLGSNEHFFRALYNNRTKEEGFIIHKRIRIENSARPSDSVIQSNIRREMGKNSKSATGVITNPSDSLKYWLEMKKKPKYFHTIDQRHVNVDTLVKDAEYGYKSINFKDALYVINTREKETDEYTNFSGLYVARPPSIKNHQISVVNIVSGPVLFSRNGNFYNPRSVLQEGIWAYEKMADTVPLDYVISTK